VNFATLQMFIIFTRIRFRGFSKHLEISENIPWRHNNM